MTRVLVLSLVSVTFLQLGYVSGNVGDLLVVESPTFLYPEKQIDIDFGFSVSVFHNETHKKLLVGAPLSNTSQVGVTSPGALYSCDVEGKLSVIYCSQLTVDTRDADDKYVPFIDEDLKDFQRLGASVSATQNQVVVCAPNWHYYEKRITLTIDAPVGMCFRSSSLEEFEPFSVPYDVTKGNTVDYLHYGSCQSGFSSTISKDQEVVLGSPGCYNWEGEVFAESKDGFVAFGKEFFSSLFEGPEEERLLLSNMYMGYSVAHGRFNGRRAVVAGIPRSAQAVIYADVIVMNPMVTIHLIDQNKLTLWATVTPPRVYEGHYESVWLFSYFGYSVTVADVDGNGLDDIIVGAPFYHKETNYDQGAILVYMQYKLSDSPGGPVYEISLEQNQKLRTGLVDYGRFGSSVANVGDMNGDGLEDVAVGAPYGEEGKVYIYLSTSQGLSQEPYQILSSLDASLKEKNLKGFGSSLGGVPASSATTQNDLMIGAPFSDTVVLFRTKVMIDVKWEVNFTNKVDLSSKCSLDGEELPCTDIVTCLSYSFLEQGKSGDKRPKEFELNHDLDVNSSPRRLFFDDKQTKKSSHIFVEFESVTCHTYTLYTSKQIDNLDAFEVISTIEHIPNTYGDESSLHNDENTVSKDTLEIYFDCVSANASKCVANLRLQSLASNDVVPAEDAKFDILYKVTNEGESSYYNKLEIEMDTFLEISGKIEIESGSTIYPIIDCRKIGDARTQCSLGTFINTDDVIVFRVSFVTTEDFLKLENLRYHDVKFKVRSYLTTLSEMKDPNSAASLNLIYIEANPEIYLTKSEASTDLVTVDVEAEYQYPDDAKDGDSVGPRVIHIYEVYNRMNYVVENNVVDVYWPHQIDDGDLLEGALTATWEERECDASYKTGFIDDGSKNVSAFGDVVWKVTSCRVPLLQPHSSIYLKLDLRLVMKTVLEDIHDPNFDEIRSYVVVVSSPTLLGHKMKLMVNNDVTTIINYGEFAFDEVPKTIYILGVVLGLFLLLLLLCCLRRLNFFKRKTTENMSRENLEKDEEEILEENEALANSEQEESVPERYDNVDIRVESVVEGVDRPQVHRA